MPRWLFVSYRFTTALVILALAAAAVGLVASAFLGVASLRDWSIHTATELRSLLPGI